MSERSVQGQINHIIDVILLCDNKIPLSKDGPIVVNDGDSLDGVNLRELFL